jgi:hypothetical protein
MKKISTLIIIVLSIVLIFVFGYVGYGSTMINIEKSIIEGSPKEGDIISVRGKGRFIYDGVSRQTKKGRLGVRIRKYV